MRKGIIPIMKTLARICQCLALILVLADPTWAAKPLGWVEGAVYKEVITKYANKENMPTSLIRAVIKTESNFNPKAVSPKGAQGLMQLMPETCQDFGVRDPFDVEQNVRAGAAYLRILMDKFNNLTLALAAYNSGPENVEQHGGVPPFEETKLYIQWVFQYYNSYRLEIDRHARPLTPAWTIKWTPAPALGSAGQGTGQRKRGVVQVPIKNLRVDLRSGS